MPFEDRKQGCVELPGELPGAVRRHGNGQAPEHGPRTGALRGRAALLDEPQGRPVGVVVVVPAVQDLADPLRTSVRVGGEQEETGRAPRERGLPLRGAFRQRPHRNRRLDTVSGDAEGGRHPGLRRSGGLLASFRFPAPPPAPVLRTGRVGDEGEGVVAEDPLAAVAVVGDVEVQGYRVLQVPGQAGAAGDVVDVVGHVGGQVDPAVVPADREAARQVGRGCGGAGRVRHAVVLQLVEPGHLRGARIEPGPVGAAPVGEIAVYRRGCGNALDIEDVVRAGAGGPGQGEAGCQEGHCLTDLLIHGYLASARGCFSPGTIQSMQTCCGNRSRPNACHLSVEVSFHEAGGAMAASPGVMQLPCRR